MDLISIIVPMYNAEKTIEICLASLSAQTYKNIEVIVVDDGSRDGSADICKVICESDNRFIYIYQYNAGVSAARNRGLELARGEFVCFVDSDDWVAHDFVEKLHACITGNDADLVFCGYITCGNGSDVPHVPEAALFEGKEKIAKEFFDDAYQDFRNSQCIRIYKRSLIKSGADTRISCGEDLGFNLRYLEGVNRLAVLGEALYFYYVPVSASIKYKSNDARQCFLYLDSVREYLDGALSEEEYLAQFEQFVCGNLCRDAALLAKCQPFCKALGKIKEFYTYPLFRTVLKHRAWRGLNIKYVILGWLLRLRLTAPLIIAAKL